MLNWCNQRSIVLTTSVDMGIIYKRVHLRTLVGGTFARLGSADNKFGDNVNGKAWNKYVCISRSNTKGCILSSADDCMHIYGPFVRYIYTGILFCM